MKKFILTGFVGYTIFNNNTVKDNATGKLLKIVKGNVKMTASDTVEGQVEAGKAYTYAISDLIEVAEATGWEDVPAQEVAATTEVADTRTPEQIAAEVEKEAFKAKTKELKEALEASKTALMEATTPEASLSALEAFKAAQADCDAHIASNKHVKAPKVEVLPTEDEQKVLDGFDAAKAEYEDAKSIYAAILEGNKDLIKKFRKGSKGTGTNSDKAPKLSYEKAQEIREKFAAGSTKADLAKEFGVTGQSISYIVNYQQHPLRKGDTAHTPLVNNHFPARWMDSKGTERNGAPLKEDGVKLTYNEKYLNIPAIEA